MEENTYKNLRPVEIIEALCQGSANGFAQSVLKTQEERLGLQLPAVLRDFLLRAGRERVCGKEKEIFSPELFQVKDGYLVLREMVDERKTGVLVEDLNKDNPPVYVQDVWGNWDLFADHMEDCLLAELDRRIRKTKTANHSLGYLGSYYYCAYLLCKEWTLCMDASEVSDTFRDEKETVPSYGEDEEEDWEDEDLEDGDEESDWDDEDRNDENRNNEDRDDEDRNDEDWNDEYDQDLCGKHWDCPQALKRTLLEKRVTLPHRSYAIAVCLEEETGILYSAHFQRDEQRFASLLQINAGLLDSEQHIAARLLRQLEKEVHAPVLAHCLTKKALLPENVRGLAEEELRSHIAETIEDFLALFENNRSWKLGVCVSDKFIECSGIEQRTKSEPLSILWYGHHLNADPPLWIPSFVRKTKEKETAPEGLEPFLKEFIYRVHDYNLLNRYSFLARKIVTKEGFSLRTQNYTEEERFALLSFYREMADGVTERIMDCLERKVFSIRIKGKDFCSFCGNPMAHLEGWIYQYERESLRFLDEGRWR